MGRSKKKKKASNMTFTVAQNTRSHLKQPETAAGIERETKTGSQIEIVTVDFKSRLMSKLGKTSSAKIMKPQRKMKRNMSLRVCDLESTLGKRKLDKSPRIQERDRSSKKLRMNVEISDLLAMHSGDAKKDQEMEINATVSRRGKKSKKGMDTRNSRSSIEKEESDSPKTKASPRNRIGKGVESAFAVRNRGGSSETSKGNDIRQNDVDLEKLEFRVDDPEQNIVRAMTGTRQYSDSRQPNDLGPERLDGPMDISFHGNSFHGNSFHGDRDESFSGERDTTDGHNLERIGPENVVSLKDPDSVLITLNHPQEFCFKGKCEISTLCGEVTVFGFHVKPGAAPYRAFSPDSNSLLVVKTKTTVDAEDIDSASEKKSIKGGLNDSDKLNVKIECVKRALQDENSEVVSAILQSMTRQSVVLRLRQLDCLCCDYVSSVSPYQGLFTQTTKASNSDIHLPIGVQIIHDRPPPVLQITENYEYASEIWCSAIGGCHDVAPVMVLCGGKNTGKSTLGRYLVNCALNCCKEVCYLECDVGQTEFSLQNCVSLSSVTQPLLGPPFTHQEDPVCSTFIGCASPADDPSHYVQCVSYVFEKYKSLFSNSPLIVNTMGWNRGLGLNLLVDILHIVQANLVVQLDSRSQSKNLPPITSHFMQTTQRWSDMDAGILPDEATLDDQQPEQSHKLTIIETAYDSQHDRKGRYSAPDHRAMATIAYLSRLQVPSSDSFLPINAHRPYMVSWRKVAVHVACGAVPPSQIMYALNGAMVALCVVKETTMLKSCDPELPRFLSSTPVSPCLGFGIIRGIDPVKKVFYIITPLPPDALNTVNCLVKGSLEVPQQMLLKQKCSTALPYVDAPRDGVGTGSTKPRRFLQRKRYSKSLLDNL